MNEPISPEMRADTYMSRLQEAGWHTALIGKHHFIDRFNVGMDVTEDDEEIRGFGFDHVWQVVDVYESLHNDDRFTQMLRERGELGKWRERVRGEGQRFYRELAPEETIDGYIGERAVAYIRDYDPVAPLYLNVGFVGPHPPYWAPAEYADRLDPDDLPPPKGVEDPDEIQRCRQRRAIYYGAVQLIDDYVGRLVEALADRGMLEETLIVFAADHGDMLGDFDIWDKRWFYDQSARVPLVMAGPGIEPDPRLGGITCKRLVSSLDLYPTLLQAAGVERSDADGREGISLIDAAADRGPRRERVFSELGTATMVRDASFKLVFDPEQGGVQQLFDLRRDPQELQNLAGEPGYEPVEKRLVEAMLSHLTRLTRRTHEKEQNRVQRVRV